MPSSSVGLRSPSRHPTPPRRGRAETRNEHRGPAVHGRPDAASDASLIRGALSETKTKHPGRAWNQTFSTYHEKEQPMTTLFDSLRCRLSHSHTARSQRDRRRNSRKAVLDFQPGWDRSPWSPGLCCPPCSGSTRPAATGTRARTGAAAACRASRMMSPSTFRRDHRHAFSE